MEFLMKFFAIDVEENLEDENQKQHDGNKGSDQLNDKITSLEQENECLHQTNRDLNEKIKSLEEKIILLNQENQNLKKELLSKKRTISEDEIQINQLSQQAMEIAAESNPNT